MPDAVIVDAVRTAHGKRNGTLGGVHPVDLMADVLSALVTMRDRGIRYGLQTMCEGGGTANATLVEVAA